MRKAALLFVIAVYAYAANAQFTLHPRFGIESPLIKISYNNSPYYKAVSQLMAQAGLRADYQFKNRFAPFFGIFTHRPLVNYSFDDPKTGLTSYHAANGDLQMQLQAGLQYSIKPITLSKKQAVTKTNPEKVSQAKSNCYHFYQNGCRKKSNEAQKTQKQSNTFTMQLQPSAGLGYIPSVKQDIETRNSGALTSYLYNAGNIKTELITGLSFEFAKNKKPFLTLGINYFKGLGTNEIMLNTESGGKPVSTNFNSKVSGWNTAIGIPISFAKKSKTTKTQNNFHHSCSEYFKRRCGK